MPDNELATDLGVPAALTVGVGTMIGAGIFVLPSVATQRVGSLLALTFLCAGLIAFVNALTVSELGTAMPKAGGSYNWVNRGLGPLFGSIAGFGDWIGLVVASAFYTLGFGIYLGVLFSLPTIPLGFVTLNGAQLGALFAGTLFVGLNYLGVKGTGRIQTLVVATLVGILMVFIADGLVRTGARELIFYETRSTETLLSGIALVFVSYLGYGKIATLGGELKNPERTIPIAVLGSVVVVTVLYTLIAALVARLVPLSELTGEVPAVLSIADLAFGSVGVALMAIAGLLATASSANFSVLSAARITFAMGRRRLVGEWLNKLHPRFATPYRSLQVTGLLIAGFILVDDLVVLAQTASAFHLVVYGLLNVALVVLRETDTDYAPSFTVPLYPFTPIAGAILSFGLIAYMDTAVIGYTAALVVGAAIWYQLYGRRRTDDEGALSQHIMRRSASLPDSAIAATAAARPDRADIRVMVSLSNPRTEQDLISLACSIAAPHDGTVVAVHVVTVPDQTPLDRGPANLDRFDRQSEQLLESAREDAVDFGVPVETHLIYSHRTMEEVFDAARRVDADALVMGWRESSPALTGRAEPAFDEIAHDLPCDVLVLKDRGFDPSRIVIPTTASENDALCAEAARLFQEGFDSEITLLHVVDGEGKRGGGERFLADWAAEHDLEGGVNRVVDTSGDVEGAIGTRAAEHTMLLMGATERGLLSRLVRRSLIYDVVEEVDCSVVLAERPHERSLLERLVG
ncbi:amino acid permease [Haloferacaceae archaeon DSL9]